MICWSDAVVLKSSALNQSERNWIESKTRTHPISVFFHLYASSIQNIHIRLIKISGLALTFHIVNRTDSRECTNQYDTTIEWTVSMISRNHFAVGLIFSECFDDLHVSQWQLVTIVHICPFFVCANGKPNQPMMRCLTYSIWVLCARLKLMTFESVRSPRVSCKRNEDFPNQNIDIYLTQVIVCRDLLFLWNESAFLPLGASGNDSRRGPEPHRISFGSP